MNIYSMDKERSRSERLAEDVLQRLDELKKQLPDNRKNSYNDAIRFLLDFWDDNRKELELNSPKNALLAKSRSKRC